MRKLLSLAALLLCALSASGQLHVAPNDPALVCSPGNWSVPTSTSVITTSSGAYCTIMFTGNSAAATFDVSHMSQYASELYYRVDGYEVQSPYTRVNVAASLTIPMPSDTAAFSWHILEIVVKSTTQQDNRYVAPSNTAVILTGLSFDSGASVMAPGQATCKIELFGDSITEGVRTVNSLQNSSNSDTDQIDAMMSWAYALRRLMGCEVGMNGYGGSGLTVTGNGNVPPLSTSYLNVESGVARAVPSGLSLIVLNEGTNDGGSTSAQVTAGLVAALNGMLVTYPGVPIAVLRTFAGFRTAELQAGIAACNNPARVHFVDTTGFFNTAYGADATGLHPSGPNDIGIIGPRVAAALMPLVYPTTPATPTLPQYSYF